MAKLEGFKGEGIVELVQEIGSNRAYAMAVLTQLEANGRYAVYYSDQPIEGSNCRNNVPRTGEDGKNEVALMELTTDHTGMAVHPWRQVLLDIYASPPNKTLLVQKVDTNQLIDCGQIRPIGNFSDYARMVNHATNSQISPYILLLFLFLLSYLKLTDFS